MRLIFIHGDGRKQPLPDAAALSAAGGYPAHPAAIVAGVLDAMSDVDLELWATWPSSPLPAPPPGQVVLMVIGDEAGQIPAHIDDFVCAFSSGSRTLGRPPRIVSPSSAWIALLEFARMVRNAARRLARSGLRWRRPANLYGFPLGGAEIAAQAPANAPAAVGARRWDLVFLGSVGRTVQLPWPFNRRIGLSPKAASRLSAATALSAAAGKDGSLSVLVGCSDHPQFGPPLDPDSYHRALSEAKISVCPRGNFAETFRHAESARAGAIVMTDRLPDEWYFENHPFVVIDDWAEAVARASCLLADASEADRLAQASRRWYETTCSPEAVAKFIVSRIAAHRTTAGEPA